MPIAKSVEGSSTFAENRLLAVRITSAKISTLDVIDMASAGLKVGAEVIDGQQWEVDDLKDAVRAEASIW